MREAKGRTVTGRAVRGRGHCKRAIQKRKKHANDGGRRKNIVGAAPKHNSRRGAGLELAPFCVEVCRAQVERW